MADLVRAGKIRHFGVSNYRAWRVAEICRLCDEAGIDRPVVSQPLSAAGAVVRLAHHLEGGGDEDRGRVGVPVGGPREEEQPVLGEAEAVRQLRRRLLRRLHRQLLRRLHRRLRRRLTGGGCPRRGARVGQQRGRRVRGHPFRQRVGEVPAFRPVWRHGNHPHRRRARLLDQPGGLVGVGRAGLVAVRPDHHLAPPQRGPVGLGRGLAAALAGDDGVAGEQRGAGIGGLLALDQQDGRAGVRRREPVQPVERHRRHRALEVPAGHVPPAPVPGGPGPPAVGVGQQLLAAAGQVEPRDREEGPPLRVAVDPKPEAAPRR